MYYYPCKSCEKMVDYNPMMNSPMNMQMMQMMPTCVDNDEDLKCMYPKIYYIVYPLVKHHCDMMEAKHGKRHCPRKDEMDQMCKDICDKCDHHRSNEIEELDPSEDNDTRQRRYYGRRRGYQDLARVLIVRNLIRRRYNY